MAEWYYMFNGQQNGPVSGSQLKSLAATGGLGPEDLIWNQSMPDWVAAQRVRGLTFARSVASPAPRQPISAPAPAYVPRPAETPQPDTYAPLPEASFAGYEAAPEQAPQALAYSQAGNEPVSFRTVEYLRQTRPWVMLVSILMFICVGIMGFVGIIGMFGMALGGAVASRSMTASGGSPGTTGGTAMSGGIMAGLGVFLMVVVLIEAALIFFPALFLMRYASAIKRLMASRQSKDLEAAMKAQKSYWMFIGILTLIGISFYAIIFLMTLGSAAMH